MAVSIELWRVLPEYLAYRVTDFILNVRNSSIGPGDGLGLQRLDIGYPLPQFRDGAVDISGVSELADLRLKRDAASHKRQSGTLVCPATRQFRIAVPVAYCGRSQQRLTPANGWRANRSKPIGRRQKRRFAVKIITSQFTITEINDMLNRENLVVNQTYQRSPRIWPLEAKSYFIDTILEGYPFPKIYFYEVYDAKRKQPRREIVDGQQRVTAFVDYFNNRFRLTASSKQFKGMRFEDLPDEQQQKFTMTPVQVDMILSADRSEILEMFRRMNAYTVPLNPAEKRHSQFQGQFKWFINELADRYSPLLEQFGILTPKQILRMGDAEFLTELALILDQGIVNRDSRSFLNIYRKYETELPQLDDWNRALTEFFDLLSGPLSPLQGTFMMKAYVVHSLFAAMMQSKYGIPNGAESVAVATRGVYYTDLARTLQTLREMAEAHEIQDTEGKWADYVEASLSTTHRIAQRQTRARWLAQALL